MILRFPCMIRQNASIPGQRHLSDYGQGVPFSDMVDYRLDQYTRSVLAENADHAVDLTYPCVRDQVEA